MGLVKNGEFNLNLGDVGATRFACNGFLVAQRTPGVDVLFGERLLENLRFDFVFVARFLAQTTGLFTDAHDDPLKVAELV